MLSPFKKIKIDDFTDVNRAQDNIASTLAPILKCNILDGHLISVSLTSGANNVSHGLGRTIQGWLIVDRSSSSTIYRTDYAAPSNADRLLNLTSSAPCNVKMWVF